MLNGPVAPSPVIPTYRPSTRNISNPSSTLSIMPTVALTDYKHFTRIPGLRKPRPRSAGASSRPMRNENIAELVRFFQAPEESEESVVGVQIDSNMDILKAGQRRLRDMGQPKSGRASIKSSDTSSSSDKKKSQRQHLQALQREGLLPGLEDLGSSKPRPSRTKHAKHNERGLLPSLEDLSDKSRPSRTRQDVEAIGRPWLDDALASVPKDEERTSSQLELPLNDLRNESLSLGDLAALVEFSVSFPELYSHDSDPPPYQAKAQSQSQSQLQLQSQASSDNGTAATNRGDHGGNEDTRRLENMTESHSRESRMEIHNPALNSQANGNRSVGAVNRHSQNKPDTDKNDDDSSYESNSDFDDAKSLAVLLRATERLGADKKRATQNTPSGERSSATTSSSAIATTTGPSKNNTKPHSLNQGVTDTPLFVRNLIENKHDGAEAAKNSNAKAPRQSNQLSPISQADANQPNNLNAGPIPLKLVAECMSPTTSKPVSPQMFNSSVPRPISNLNGDIALLRPPSNTLGPTSASFPRPRALLSPIPIQSRRARSVTPDIASDMQKKGKKKNKKAPLYVVTDAAPLPPPAKPLPSLPQSADVLGAKPVQGERSVSTPAQPASAPLEYRVEDRDSPVLGMNPRKLKLQRSLVHRPSSRYSNRSIDASDASRNSSDDQSSRTASPAVSRPESQQGRANHVHAIRMRDIDAKKRKDAPAVGTSTNLGPGVHSMKHGDPHQLQPEYQNQVDQMRFSKRNRISAVPDFPLPKNPPVNAQGTPKLRRRGSTTSLPGSISTMNGYEGGLSRSVSVTSGSIDSISIASIQRGKAARVPTDAIQNLSHGNFQPESPLLPSSDDERHDPQMRRPKKTGSIEDNGESETRQVNRRLANTKSKQSTKQKATSNHTKSSPSEVSQHAFLPSSSDNRMGYTRVLHHLESRIATLERQNKMLQAALLAALDVGVSHDADSAQSRSTSPALSSMRVPTISERAMPSSNNLGIDSARQRQGKAAQRNHESRNLYTQDVASQGSRGSFETTSSHSDGSVRLVEGVLGPDVGR